MDNSLAQLSSDEELLVVDRELPDDVRTKQDEAVSMDFEDDAHIEGKLCHRSKKYQAM